MRPQYLQCRESVRSRTAPRNIAKYWGKYRPDAHRFNHRAQQKFAGKPALEEFLAMKSRQAITLFAVG
jgi:hypothetical protein